MSSNNLHGKNQNFAGHSLILYVLINTVLNYKRKCGWGTIIKISVLRFLKVYPGYPETLTKGEAENLSKHSDCKENYFSVSSICFHDLLITLRGCKCF
jgi:hypothetical protein